MKVIGTFLFASALFLWGAGAEAAERGAVIRAGDLKAEPFLDAATATSVSANQQVTILARRGGWLQVDSNGKQGWLRMLNVRPATNAAAGKPKAQSAGLSPASLFRTGSSGKTVATGVKGMDEEDIRNASPNPAQVAALATLAVASAEATANAKASGLKENAVEHLDKGGKK